MPPSREPQVILVTGASQGLGEAIARAFARERAGPLVLAARQDARLEKVAAACLEDGAPEAVPLRCDVTDPADVASLHASVEARFGRLDVLVNNAGRYAGAPALGSSLATFDAMIAANLRSVFLVTQAFLPGMAARRSGHILIMGSVASIKGLRGSSAYCAAKAGVLGYARTLREELRDSGIRVTTILPGAAWSPSWEGSGVPAERMMTADDVASAFVAAWRMSPATVVEELVLRPQLGDL